MVYLLGYVGTWERPRALVYRPPMRRQRRGTGPSPPRPAKAVQVIQRTNVDLPARHRRRGVTLFAQLVAGDDLQAVTRPHDPRLAVVRHEVEAATRRHR